MHLLEPTIGVEATLLLHGLLRLLDFRLSESFHSSFSFFFELLCRHACLCSFVHLTKSLLTLESFSFDTLFRFDAKSLLSFFESLLVHLFSHDAKALCSFLLLFLLLFELL